MTPETVYLSLGSNLGDREDNLRQAVALLAGAGLESIRISSVYETAPRDLEDQPVFLNLAVEARSAFPPELLLARIRAIEDRLGRQRTQPKGPRTLDIDILLYGEHAVDLPHLEIPHPRMAERRFVLEPLAELAPGLKHPTLNLPVADLLRTLPPQGVRRAGPLEAKP